MNFTDPLLHPSTANIRDALQDWSLVESSDQRKQEILEHAKPFINALREYRSNSISDTSPNWFDRLAFYMSTAKFRAEVRRFYSEFYSGFEKGGIESAIFQIEDEVKRAQVTPLTDRYMEYSKNEPDEETVSEFHKRAQPVLDMLNQYVENEFYPSWESESAWKLSEYYDPDIYAGWIYEQGELRYEDSLMVHGILGTVSAFTIQHNGKGLVTESGDRLLNSISIDVIQKSKLLRYG